MFIETQLAQLDCADAERIVMSLRLALKASADEGRPPKKKASLATTPPLPRKKAKSKAGDDESDDGDSEGSPPETLLYGHVYMIRVGKHPYWPAKVELAYFLVNYDFGVLAVVVCARSRAFVFVLGSARSETVINLPC
jgi:hypothetical protein